MGINNIVKTLSFERKTQKTVIFDFCPVYLKINIFLRTDKRIKKIIFSCTRFNNIQTVLK